MLWLNLSAMLCFCQGAALESFAAPGYDAPVPGAWYGPGEAASAIPLGGLGTGFVEFGSDATFGAAVTENTWLEPEPVPPKCGLTISAGDRTLDLFPGAVPADTPLRFWGHYPAADVDFGGAFGDTTVYLRAFAPVIPHDYAASGLPVVFFRFALENRGAVESPVELALQWQANPKLGAEASGNVECALGWNRETLQPGQTWTICPVLVFARGRDELEARVRELRFDPARYAPPDAAQDSPTGKTYACGAVTGVAVDAAGGFDWEIGGRQAAEFDGTPHIGQILWTLAFDNARAGYGLQGPYGLESHSLPARTANRALEVALRVLKAGPDSVAFAYTVSNVSPVEVRDLRFGFAVNADLGGPERAEAQTARFLQPLGAVVFEAVATDVTLAVAGRFDEYIVETWPRAHEAMDRNALVSAVQPSPEPTPKSIPDGIQLDLPKGSYALAAYCDTDWSLQNAQLERGVIRSRARKTLAPGERDEVLFALAWHFPYWTSSDGERLRHHYAAQCADAGEVIKTALTRAAEFERRIVRWQQAVYGSGAPPLLQDAVINGLYILPRNAWWLDDGRFFQSESFTGCPITETFVCRFYGSLPLALLFPECERATMRSVAAAQAPSGEIPFGFGSPMGSRSPCYHVQHPIVSPEFVLLVWRNYRLWNEPAWLDEMYPRIQAALRFSMTLDKDGDGLVDEDPGSEKGFPANQYYDIWPWWGVSAYTGSIGLAALRAGEEMARARGDEAFAAELRDRFARGARAFEDKLWTGAYYRLYNDPARNRRSDTSLANALCGQWFAYATGLGELVPKDHIQSVIDTVLRLNAAATPYGAVNGVLPDGKPDLSFPDHSAVVTIGEVWSFCAMAAFAGRAEDARALFNRSYENILLRQRTPWNIPWSLDRDAGAIKWGIHYYSNPCVWTLFQALDPDAIARLAGAAGKGPREPL